MTNWRNKEGYAQKVKVCVICFFGGQRRWVNGYIVGPRQLPPQEAVLDVKLGTKMWPVFAPNRQSFYWVEDKYIKWPE